MTNNLHEHAGSEMLRDDERISEAEQNPNTDNMIADVTETIAESASPVVDNADNIENEAPKVSSDVSDEAPVAESSEETVEENAESEDEVAVSEKEADASDKESEEEIADEEVVSEDSSAVPEEATAATDESDTEESESADEPAAGKTDYAELDRDAIVEHLRRLIEKGDIDTVRDDIDAIKFHFYKKLKAETDLKHSQYVEGGGIAEEYIYEEDAQELILKNLVNKYREMRNAQNEQLESVKQHNLEEKLKIIEELKELANGTESIGETFQSFRDLQNRWRSVGLVPQSEVKNLWDTYHHFVEIFYDYIKINRELRDLDFKRNLEAKLELCEKTESLLLSPSIVSAFRSLQTYHDQWREIGPVPQEMRVEIWERFKAASTQINRKHQEYFETLKDSQKKNLEAKEALCEKADEIAQRPLTTASQWEKNSKEIIELQKLWNTIGFASKKDNGKIYKRFHAICDRFFNQKREFFSKEKGEQENNLQLKEDLCVQAEALKDSTEWKSTTEDLVQLQKKWKEIGSVPPKYREPLWKRFRTACDHFFEQKAKHFSSIDSEYDNNLKAKQELIDKIKNFAHSNNVEENFEQLKAFQRDWSAIGFVPIKYKKRVQEEYRTAINKQFDALRLNDSERNRLRYKNKIENLVSASQSRGKLESERDRLMRKYQQLQNDLVVWENNIGFFSKSKNSEAMIANVQRMIEQGKTEMKELEDKIRIIDAVEDNEG